MSEQEQTVPAQNQPVAQTTAPAQTTNLNPKGSKMPKFVWVLLSILLLAALVAGYLFMRYKSNKSEREMLAQEEEQASAFIATGRVYDVEGDQLQLKISDSESEIQIVSVTIDSNTIFNAMSDGGSGREQISLQDLRLDNLVSVISDLEIENKTQIYAKEVLLIN